MAPSSPQFGYSIIGYLNDATVHLRYLTADVLPKWAGVTRNVQDVTGSAATLVAGIAQSISEALVRKISLTGQLQEDKNHWDIYNEMSGIRWQVRNQTDKGRSVTAQFFLTNTFELLDEFDGKLTPLLDKAHLLKTLVQGVANEQLTNPIPDNVTALLNDMRAYNDSSKANLWNLLDPTGSWNSDSARIAILNRLGPFTNEYPQAQVLWARFLCPQVEAIEQQANTIAREVQLRRGTWQLIGNYLSNVDSLLGEENEADRMSWYQDPFSIFAKTQLRMMQTVGGLCAG